MLNTLFNMILGIAISCMFIGFLDYLGHNIKIVDRTFFETDYFIAICMVAGVFYKYIIEIIGE